MDHSYRAGLAKLVEDLKAQHQFFIITFRPDLVPMMDKCYEIRYFGRYSQIREVTNKVAENIVTRA